MSIVQENLATVSVLTPPQAGSSAAASVPRTLAQAISNSFCGAADLTVLGAAFIYLVLINSGLAASNRIVDLLTVKMSAAHFIVLIACLVLWRAAFLYSGLYTWQQIRSSRGIIGRVILATGISSILAGFVISKMWLHGSLIRNTLSYWIAAAFGALLVRGAVAGFHCYIRPHFRTARRVVIVGSGSRAERVHQELLIHPEWNYEVLGFVDSYPQGMPGTIDHMLGRIGDLEELLMKHVVDEVVIALPMKSQYAAIERSIAICERAGVKSQYCSDLFETSVAKSIYTERHSNSRIVMEMVHRDYRHHIKRALDIVGAGAGLIFLSPLFLLVAIIIKCTSKGPVFFRQERYGLNKRIFWIYKFRSMVVDAEAAQKQLEHMNENSGPVFKIFNDPRITKIGAFLRKTSVDELPQLFNVLKGEMSLVGPRPLNKRDVGRFSEAWLMRRFSVQPGLTCLWQVGGRSTVSFDRWIALDLQYIDQWNLLLDLKILAMTFPAVLKGRGAA